ncbi:thrombospondin [Bergeyella sp. RCAD1439]|uniref:thrombospondin n=1 Tax=Bergeyella anatis TaxID=3113737 RepID=UPI002E17410B|nr:thrombospondin [Bergeyella sp. RCAD1439]
MSHKFHLSPLVFLCLLCSSIAGFGQISTPLPPLEDYDGDGVLNIYDLDSDNDGIPDALEKYNGFLNTEGISRLTSASKGRYKQELLFFDWTGKQLSKTSPSISSTAVFNGVTYTATIYDYEVIDNKGNANFPIFNPSNIKVENINTNYLGIFNLYNYDTTKTTLKPGLHYNKPSSDSSGKKVSFKIKVTASDNNTAFKMVPMDIEATTDNVEYYKFTSANSSPFIFLEDNVVTDVATRVEGNNFTKNNNNFYVINGAGTATLTYVNTEKKEAVTSDNLKGNALFYARTSEISVETLMGGGQGFSIAVIPPYSDADQDGIPDYLDTDSDGDGCPDAVEGSDNVNLSHLAQNNMTAPFKANKWAIITNFNGVISSNGDDIVSKSNTAMGIPEIVNPATNNTVSNSKGIADTDNAVGQATNNGAPYNAGINSRCFCTLLNSTASNTPQQTKVGITSLGRAGSTDTDNWPMARNGGHLAIESNTKGFTITRMTTNQITNIANPVIGMLVYDETVHCLKAYVETSPSTKEWKCMNQTGCPNGVEFTQNL